MNGPIDLTERDQANAAVEQAMNAPDWTDTDLDDNEPGAWLSGPDLRVGTVGLHLYAIRVHDVAFVQEATDEPMQQELEHVQDLVGARPETTTINGFDGEYVVYAIPTAD